MADPSPDRPRRTPAVRTAGVYLALLAVVFAVRAPAFRWSQVNPDESINLLVGRTVLGGDLPYVRVWDHKPPLMYWASAAAQLLFGRRPQSLQVLACLAIAATATALYRIAAGAFAGDRRWPFVPAGVYVLSSLSNNGLSAHTEHLVSACVAVGAALVARPTPSWGRYALAGLAFGVGCQLKFLAAFEVAGVAAFVLWTESTWRRGVAAVALLAAMTLVPFAVTVAVYAAAGQLDLLLYTDFRYNAAYAAAARFSASHLGRAAAEQLAAAPWLWVAAAGAVVWARDVDRRTFRLSAAWAVAAVASALSTKRFYGHYFLTPYPPLSLLTGLALYRAARRTAAARAAAAAVVLALAVEQGARLGQQWYLVVTRPDNPARVAAYVRRQLRPGQTFYLAGGTAVIYYLADATPPTPFAFPQQVSSTLWPRLPETDPDAELARVMSRRPALVVLSNEDRAAPDERAYLRSLDAYLARDYGPPTVLNGYAVYPRAARP